jgi:hypothetical protein
VKKILAGALGGAAVAVAIFGAGPANADNEWAGRTYEQVASALGQAPVIASRVGDYLPTPQCVVTRSRTANFLDSSGNKSGKVHVYLNCGDTKTAGHPGYSAATPTGQKAQTRRQQSAMISEDYAKSNADGKTPICERDDQYITWCTQVCTDSGSCSAELTEALGL